MKPWHVVLLLISAMSYKFSRSEHCDINISCFICTFFFPQVPTKQHLVALFLLIRDLEYVVLQICFSQGFILRFIYHLNSFLVLKSNYFSMKAKLGKVLRCINEVKYNVTPTDTTKIRNLRDYGSSAMEVYYQWEQTVAWGGDGRDFSINPSFLLRVVILIQYMQTSSEIPHWYWKETLTKKQGSKWLFF